MNDVSTEPIHSPVLAMFPYVAQLPDLMDVLRVSQTLFSYAALLEPFDGDNFGITNTNAYIHTYMGFLVKRV